MKNKEITPLLLLIVSVALMTVSILLNSLLVIAGVTGLVVAWFLCIDRLITSSKVSTRLLFAAAVIGLPIFVTAMMG